MGQQYQFWISLASFMPFDRNFFTMTNNNSNASPIYTFESNSCGGAWQPSAMFAFACDFEMDT